MVSKKSESGFIIRLEKNEELISSLKQFVADQKIKSAKVQGIGGLLSAQLGYYNLKRKKYTFRHIKDVVELVSLLGNITTSKEGPALHLHAVVSDVRNKAYGGHLKSAVIGGTCEIFVEIVPLQIKRKSNEEIGLPLLDL